MTSISLSVALPASLHADASSHFSPVPSQSLTTTPVHTRRHSRNPNVPPLPAFSFNPGALAEPDVGHQVSPSPPPSIVDDMAQQKQGLKASKPPPLPDFSFNPGANIDVQPIPSPSHPILEEMAGVVHVQSHRPAKPAALPSFSFNPGLTEAQPSPSPTASNFGDVSNPARAIGHRRHGSELMGGDNTQLTAPAMGSVSPHKRENNARTPGLPLAGHGPARQGHQHRRSQAVSISEIDTSELIKANAVAKHRAGSAPATPAENPIDMPFFAHERRPRTSQSVSSLSGKTPLTPPFSPSRRGSAPGARPRVGFSDTIDVIPRPLSLISSETEGSTSTIRGNHSLTGSLNSLGAVSPSGRSISSLSAAMDDGSPRTRPRTADAANLVSLNFRRIDEYLSESNLPKRPLSASDLVPRSESPPNKKKHFWFGGNISNESFPKPSPSVTPSDHMATSLPAFGPSEFSEVVRPKTSPERKASIKKRKVRTLAGAIFSRKGKHRAMKAKGRRTPTPPLLTRQMTDEINDSIFDADNTIVIRNSHSPIRQRKTFNETECLSSSAPALSYDSDLGDRVTSPIIDLDAALGPFGSEEKLGSDEKLHKGRSRMELHSSQGRMPLDAFGVVHRRAESAPQMAPVNRSAFGLHHMGSKTSIVEDVFDEEEEDDFLAGQSETHDTATVSGPSTPSKTDPSSLPTTNQTPEKESHLGNAKKQEPEPMAKPDALGLAISAGVVDTVEIVDTDGDLSREPARSSNSTITAPVLGDGVLQKRHGSSPMEFAYPAPQLSYASSTEGRTAPSSAISSPDAEHISFDNNTRYTQPLIEPSPDLALRSSTDDLPSLTDSVSTGAVPRFSSSAGTRSSTEQRSTSVSVPTTGKVNQAWKRASFASLNKLMPGPSSTEKSKLRFGQSVEHLPMDKEKKKGNRLTRLILFWRAKEKEGN